MGNVDLQNYQNCGMIKMQEEWPFYIAIWVSLFVLDETESEDESPRENYLDDTMFSASDDDFLCRKPFLQTSNINNQPSFIS